MTPFFWIPASKESEPVRTELTDKKQLTIQGKECIVFASAPFAPSVWIGPTSPSDHLPIIGTDKDGQTVNISRTSLIGAMFIKDSATPVTLTTPEGKELGKVIYEAPKNPTP